MSDRWDYIGGTYQRWIDGYRYSIKQQDQGWAVYRDREQVAYRLSLKAAKEWVDEHGGDGYVSGTQVGQDSTQ